MPENQFDIKELFKIVWNYMPAPFPLAGVPWKTSLPGFKGLGSGDYEIPATTKKLQSDLGEDFFANNLLGLEVFMPIVLSYTDTQNNMTHTLQLENTILSVDLNKSIIETPLVNREGAVLEEISIDNWQIDIKGIIVAPDDTYYNSYPDGEVKKLKDMVYAGFALNIKNALTAICLANDEKIVIRHFKLMDMKGVENAQAFELTCISDIPFELVLQD